MSCNARLLSTTAVAVLPALLSYGTTFEARAIGILSTTGQRCLQVEREMQDSMSFVARYRFPGVSLFHLPRDETNQRFQFPSAQPGASSQCSPESVEFAY